MSSSEDIKVLAGADPATISEALDKEELTLKALKSHFVEELERVQLEETLLRRQLEVEMRALGQTDTVPAFQFQQGKKTGETQAPSASDESKDAHMPQASSLLPQDPDQGTSSLRELLEQSLHDSQPSM